MAHDRPTTLYHVTTPKKARTYRSTGHIKAPVRGFDTIGAALAWAVKTGRTVILQLNHLSSSTVHKLPDHHNDFGDAWWVDANVDNWVTQFSAKERIDPFPPTDVHLHVKMALDFAKKSHGPQSYGQLTYFEGHILVVTGIAAPYGEGAMVVAALHDVIEDTAETEEEAAAILHDIALVFGSNTARCVELVSDPKHLERRKDKKAFVMKALRDHRETHPDAVIAKICDRVANVQACVQMKDSRLEMYRQEQKAFQDALFIEGMCDPLWAQLTFLFHITK